MDSSVAINGGLAALVLSLGIGAGIYYAPDDPEAAAAAKAVEADRAAVEVKSSGALTSDLDSQLVPPGKVMVTTVQLPPGFVASPKSLTLTGKAIGQFTVQDIKQVGDTFLVMATNTGKEPVRFAATFTYVHP